MNLVTYGFTNVDCNENYIFTNHTFVLMPHECTIHDYVIMFDVKDKLQQLLLQGQLTQLWLMMIQSLMLPCKPCKLIPKVMFRRDVDYNFGNH
jgi:hypothetical protein